MCTINNECDNRENVQKFEMKSTKITKTIFANYLILYLRKSLNIKEISQII